ncbi:MAG: tripartite tricarboxylate transporter substrate binding protein [Burkholderiales bacterium]|nr:tripartite tricarboxylate transporter substrate binding protein [Burkholderiales bacterium]
MRQIIQTFLMGLAALAAAPAAAQATEPRPVRIVVPAPPGGSLDASARLLVQKLSAVTTESYLVENRPGANTQIGTEAVVRAAADGRTLLFAGTGVIFLPLLQKVAFSPMTDLVPVAQWSAEQYVVVTSAAGPLQAVADLATARPAGLNCAAYPGVSTIACEQLKARLGGRSTTVPFAGIAPAANAVMGGHADVLFVNLEPVHKLITGGRLRVLAQSKGAGFAAPTVAEAWPGFVLEGHAGVLAPAGTPEARIQQLNRDINRALADPEVAAHMREGGQEPVGGTPQRYADNLRRSLQLYGDLIQKLDLGPK